MRRHIYTAHQELMAMIYLKENSSLLYTVFNIFYMNFVLFALTLKIYFWFFQKISITSEVTHFVLYLEFWTHPYSHFRISQPFKHLVLYNIKYFTTYQLNLDLKYACVYITCIWSLMPISKILIPTFFLKVSVKMWIKSGDYHCDKL